MHSKPSLKLVCFLPSNGKAFLDLAKGLKNFFRPSLCIALKLTQSALL